MLVNRIFDITDAIVSLRPNANWSIVGDNYADLQWLDAPETKPTEWELKDEVERLQQEYDNTEYQRLRAAEYPNFADYLDGLVKGDESQMQAYIDACLAVKAKYPKPE
jgi:hypothetical protein